MEQKIKKYLAEIEKEYEITILLACETGSRAWGFPSPDSDYDVRVIYKHRKDWYLNLIEQKDSIELMLDNNEIDISGWDLRKSLRLIWKSNPPLIERIQSPIIYKCDDEFLTGMTTIAKETYSRIATIHHYLSMAKKCYEEVIGKEEYKIKKFFYALRSAIACKWILEKEELPPIVFQKMLENLNLDKNIKNRIYDLIELKSQIDESYMHSGDLELINFISGCINQAEEKSKDLPSANADINDLNLFFIKMLND